MTDEILNQGEQFVTEYKANVEALTAAHAYDPADEHDACGVGMIAAIDGKPRRSVVEKGIEALKAVWHRGAVDADGKTGDGAGIHIQVPQQFFHDYVKLIGHIPPDRPLAVGQVFLPRLSLEAQERCRCIVETEILNFGYYIYGWRQVPVNVDIIGEKANATRPEIEQIIIGNAKGETDDKFELELYIIRRRIESRRPGRADQRLLYLHPVVALDRLQGHVPGGTAHLVLSGPAGRALRFQRRDLPPALLDQHVPDMAAGPALPHARPQRRDQHAEGQRELDEGP